MFSTYINITEQSKYFAAYNGSELVYATVDEDEWQVWYTANAHLFQPATDPEETEAELMAQMEAIWEKLKAKRK